jgi:predicted MFS family arabinose efflux permease
VNGAESAGLNILGPVIAKESLGGAAVWGLVLAALGVGLVLGSLVALRIRPERPLLVGVVAITLLVPPLVLLAFEAPWQAIAASALLAGIGIELFSVFWDTSLQAHVPNEVLSRVSAWDAIGIEQTLWLCAGIVFVGISSQLLSREVRELPRTPPTPA